jgi:hypothetical protein
MKMIVVQFRQEWARIFIHAAVCELAIQTIVVQAFEQCPKPFHAKLHVGSVVSWVKQS